MTREIIVKGQVILVDDADYEAVSAIRWTIGKWNVSHYKLGSLAAFLMRPERGFEVDHIDRNILNNRRENLRVCTHAENMRNRASAVGPVGYRGIKVTEAGNYDTHLKLDGIIIRICGIATAVEAAVAYDEMARALHGEFAFLNFPDGRDWILPTVRKPFGNGGTDSWNGVEPIGQWAVRRYASKAANGRSRDYSDLDEAAA